MLGECHAHVIMDGKNYKEAVALHKNGVMDEVIHACFSKYRDAGVTFIRDGGDSFGVSKRAKEIAPEYGITYLTPIFAIHKKGHYGGIVGRSFEDLREYQELVKEAKESGADFIKIMVSGLIDFRRYGVLTIVGTVTIMFAYCWQLTLITMISVILTVVITKKMSSMMRKIYRRRSELLGQLNGHSEEMITGYKSIVAYNKQEDVIAEFDKTSDELTKVAIKSEMLGGSMGPIMNSISNISFVIVAAFGGYFAYTGLITIGTVSAFIIYAKQFSRPINEIAQLYGTIQTAIAGAERVFALLDQPDEDNCGTIELENITGKISFRNVNFSYVPEKQVLFDFDLEVEPGQKIALVGSTGSGKTTVVNLLMRFYPVDSGEILVDGVNIWDIKRDFLRDNIAIVLQDTVLFSNTIENNIKYANLEASDEEMVNAAKMSHIRGYIERLPQKYQTFLKQAGVGLSHGQRQLMSIARAILADPKILILDEATSSVDTRTEKKIQDAMVKLMKNRTSLIIAHRLSTIRDADKIVVMDQGRVVEIGNHEELLAKQGKYYELYMTQFAGNAI